MILAPGAAWPWTGKKTMNAGMCGFSTLNHSAAGSQTATLPQGKAWPVIELPAGLGKVKAPYRLLVTASRDWRDPLNMWMVLKECHVAAQHDGRAMVIVHGDAPGGDQIAKLYGLINPGATEESHPADWTGPCKPTCTPGHRKWRPGLGEYCPAAGMYRNLDMIKAGAWRCAAFIHNNSPGASGCAQKAQNAGIPTRRHRTYDHTS